MAAADPPGAPGVPLDPFGEEPDPSGVDGGGDASPAGWMPGTVLELAAGPGTAVVAGDSALSRPPALLHPASVSPIIINAARRTARLLVGPPTP